MLSLWCSCVVRCVLHLSFCNDHILLYLFFSYVCPLYLLYFWCWCLFSSISSSFSSFLASLSWTTPTTSTWTVNICCSQYQFSVCALSHTFFAFASVIVQFLELSLFAGIAEKYWRQLTIFMCAGSQLDTTEHFAYLYIPASFSHQKNIYIFCHSCYTKWPVARVAVRERDWANKYEGAKWKCAQNCSPVNVAKEPLSNGFTYETTTTTAPKRGRERNKYARVCMLASMMRLSGRI